MVSSTISKLNDTFYTVYYDRARTCDFQCYSASYCISRRCMLQYAYLGELV